ncbi:two-partner secretion domain-containing protein [Nostoc sp.]|uniref:two-partner secretion domain-containing protein n=1 Tax=Nostoc sp. TaxID=1180 RepID=UPI002FF7F9F2
MKTLWFAVTRWLGCVGGIAIYTHPAFAQLTPDNSLGKERSQVIPINTNNDCIEGGAARGANLFHSFQDFNVGEGQGVYFANPEGITNIFSRVTGGNSSNIFGRLGVLGGANLFLLNPNGILFGKNASLDVQGSFVGTTANGIQFGNQGVFSATNPEAPPLLTINPSALLFNQINQNASIQNNSVASADIDPAGFNAVGLRVPDGKSLLLVGGNVSMDGGQLNAYGGRVELGGLAESGNINLLFDGDNLKLGFPENVTRADVSLTNQAFVYVEAAGGGDIAINARNFELFEGSELSAGIGRGLGTPETIAGDITLNATGEIKVADSGSKISNLVRGDSKGNSGNIFIDSGSFLLRDGARLNASTFGQGNAGNVTVIAKDVVSLVGGDIFNNVESGSVGNTENIDITTGSLFVTNGAQLQSLTLGRGNAGNITIQARDAATFDGVDSNGFPSASFSSVGSGAVGNGGKINITASSLSLTNNGKLDVGVDGAFGTIPAGQGKGGAVDINVRDAFTIGTNSGIFGSLGTGAIGRGGDIKVEAGNIFVKDGGEIVSNTFGKGDSGNISITARDAISLDTASYIVNNVQSSDAVGNAGNIDITTGSLSVTNGTQINSFTRGQGNAGDITIQAKDAVTFDGVGSNGFSSGSLSNVQAGGVGNGGKIKITAGSLSLTNNGQLGVGVGEALDTIPAGEGKGGTVDINVRDAFTISGTNGGIFGSLGTGAVGRGGDIKVEAGNIFIKNDGQIISSTFGEGDAGKISITARDTVSLFGQGRSSIQNDVDSGGVGNSGGISINTGSLFLSDLAVITSNVDGRGNSGGVNIIARNLVSLDEAGELSRAGQPGTLILSRVNDGGEGNSGDINIKTGSLRASNSQITTSTRSKGNSGNVIIEARDEVALLRSSEIFTEVTCACETESGKGGDGRGGDIRITTGSLLLNAGSNLRADTEAKGNAGNIIINARDSITFSGSSEEFTSGAFSQVEPEGVGRGGDIIINTGNLSLSGDQEINTRTQGQGDAGNILINANSISLAGSDVFISSGASQDERLTGTSGKGGDINITTNSLLVTDGAKLSANTEIQDAAGNININASRLTLDNRGSITSESIADGNGGNIKLNLRDFLLMRHGSQISTTAGNAQAGGNGGNINIDSKFIAASPEENSDISANAYTGSGGKVQINSQGIFGIEARPKPTKKSDITASSELGVSGITNINAPDNSYILNSFTGAFPNVIDTNALIANSCISRSSKQKGTFFITGSGALRNSPGDGLISIYSTGEVRNVETISQTWKKGDAIVEPQGLYRLADGRLVLSRECQ